MGSEDPAVTKITCRLSWNVLVGGGRRNEEPTNKYMESLAEGGRQEGESGSGHRDGLLHEATSEQRPGDDDALRPHEAGLGAAPPGRPGSGRLPDTCRGEKAPGDAHMRCLALPVGLADPCETISVQLLALIESKLQRDE